MAAITGFVSSRRVGPIGPSPSGVIRFASTLGDRLEIGPGAEDAAVAGEHGNAQPVVRVEAPEGGCQRLGVLSVDRVAAVGPVDRHRGDGTLDGVVDRHDVTLAQAG
jgi:hypothetical protein